MIHKNDQVINGNKTEEQLESEAAAWFTLMHSGDVSPDVSKGFEAWLHADRTHKIAYREFEQVYRDLDSVAAEAGIDIDSALGRSRSGWRSLSPQWIKGTAFVRISIAASLALMVFVVATFVSDPEPMTDGQDHVTATAEIRELVLEDGTIITLGAKSRIASDFTERRRQVTLLEGEAFFDVATDATRPFFVAAQDTLVRVVGTQFGVKRSAEIVHVSVLEGVVEVIKPNNIQETIETADTSDLEKQVLTAGQRVSAARRVSLPQARNVGKADPGAWRTGRLTYENASLAEIIADVNRYYNRPIRIASSDVGDLRTTLAVQTTEIYQIFSVIEAIHPVEVVWPPSGDIVLRRKR